jgi:hypothetical protein
MALYMHLILAQIENLSKMEELDLKKGDMVSLDKETWNLTNVMNAKVIHHLVKRLPQLAEEVELEPFQLQVEVLIEKDIYLLEDGVIRLSKNLIQLGLQSNGHLDPYFGPFLLHKFTFEASYWFINFTDYELALKNYKNIYEQMAKEDEEFSHLDF